MNYLALIFTTLLLVLTILFIIGALLSAADFSKEFDTKLRQRYVNTHMKKYRRKLFYGK
jgi:hypothetical protein